MSSSQLDMSNLSMPEEAQLENFTSDTLKSLLTKQIDYNNNLLQELQQYEKQNQNLKREVSQKDAALRHVEEQLADATEQLDEQHQELYNFELRANQEQSIIHNSNKLKQQNQELMASHANVEQKYETLLQKTTSLNKHCEDLKQSLEKQKRAHHDAIQSKESNIFNLQSQLQKIQLEFEEYQTVQAQKLSSLTNENNANQNLHSQYYEALQGIQSHLHHYITEVKRNDNAIVNTSHSLQQHKHQLELFQQADETSYMRLLNEHQQYVDAHKKLKSQYAIVMDNVDRASLELEEERSKTIMLEERISKLESKLALSEQSQQVRAENLNRQHQRDLQKFNQDVTEKNNQLLALQKETKELRMQNHQYELQGNELRANSRRSMLQVKSMGENMKQFQNQLEKTKNLLAAVQKERSSLQNECDELRSELHKSIAKRTTPIRKRSSMANSPLSNSLRSSSNASTSLFARPQIKPQPTTTNTATPQKKPGRFLFSDRRNSSFNSEKAASQPVPSMTTMEAKFKSLQSTYAKQQASRQSSTRQRMNRFS